jgi:hypothetical protein
MAVVGQPHENATSQRVIANLFVPP